MRSNLRHEVALQVMASHLNVANSLRDGLVPQALAALQGYSSPKLAKHH